MSQPNYEAGWRALSEPLSWMHDCQSLKAYWGWGLAEIANDLIDRAYPGLRDGTAAPAPAPSCAPGEVERRDKIARIINPIPFRYWQSMYDYCLRKGDDEATARRYADETHKPECDKVYARADAILAALSPQGLDAKKGATSPDAATHSPRPRG